MSALQVSAGRVPYGALVEENQRRRGQGPEYELLDTGVFDDDRYFDIFIEYAKADADDLAIRITAHNRGRDPAPLHILPTLWFRNTWAWGAVAKARAADLERFGSRRVPGGQRRRDPAGSEHPGELPARHALPLRRVGPGAVHRQREPRRAGSTAGRPERKPHTKDAFHRAGLRSRFAGGAVDGQGTKAALHYRHVVPGGSSVTVRLRFTARPTEAPLAAVDQIIAERKAEADVFYAQLAPREATVDERLVQRRALAGLLWSKQSYLFDVARWLDGDDPARPAAGRAQDDPQPPLAAPQLDADHVDAR